MPERRVEVDVDGRRLSLSNLDKVLYPADGFTKGWEQWLRGANDVLDALHTMSRLLGDTGHDYAGSDTSSADSLKAVWGVCDGRASG